MRISDWSSDVCSSDLSEFPLPVRAQREAGARLLLVPSCTDTQAGATRVRGGCMARALENRLFVAQAVKIGGAMGRERVGQYVQVSVVDGTLNKKQVQ